MTQVVKSYKVLLDPITTNADKNLVVDLGEAFQFHDYRDLIHLRSETYMDKFFEKENPTIDFEKYQFKPHSDLNGIDFYFYLQARSGLSPISYNDSQLPNWAIDNGIYKISSGFDSTSEIKSTLFLSSYFKFDFSLDPISQKTLFSVALPLDGTMLQPTGIPRPEVTFKQKIKTEIENIYWLRKPQQLPNVNFTGTTFDLYCMVSFFNSKTGKVINFRRDMIPNVTTNDDLLPGTNLLATTYTVRDKYLIYRLDYSNLTYKILHIDGTPFNSDRIKLYSI